ncbi:MAG TPA: ribosome maturation factor RimM [Pyrinomonadaceae bacterium]|nr:ribosome maturation factor RimM [Pyrinomonadaceae bacterium]
MSEATTSGAPDGIEPGGEEELIAVARVVKVRGIRGEVAAELLTDFPERFEGLEELVSIDAGGARETLALEDSWLHGGRVILKFAGYETPEAAQALVGRELAVPETDAVELEEDEFYDWQLIDCRVETVEGQEIGRVAEVLHTGAAPVLVVREGKREHLIPLAASICVEIDREAKLIRVDPPEGLIEI